MGRPERGCSRSRSKVSERLHTACVAMIAHLSHQGDVVEARIISLAGPRPPGGGLRGAVTEFSRASRRRLIDLMARLDVARSRVVFVTLTFASIPTHALAMGAFRRFTMRIRRRFPQASALWRKERQERGAFHFHMLFFNLPYIPQAELQTIWTACTRESLSIVDIRLVKSKKAAMSYVSKYIAKTDTPPVTTSLEDTAYQHAPLPPDKGRWWGIVNQASLPMGVLFETLVEDDKEVERFFNMVNDMSKGKGSGSLVVARLYNARSGVLFAEMLGRVRNQGPSVLKRLVELIRWRNGNSFAPASGGAVNQ